MKWHDYPLAFKQFAEFHKYNGTPRERLRQLQNIRVEPSNRSAWNSSMMHVEGEVRWIEAGRPFYNVWPSVIEPFTKIDLSKINCTQIHLPLPEILVRLPAGFELCGARSFLALGLRVRDQRGIMLCIDDGSVFPEVPSLIVHTTMSFEILNESILDRLEWGRKHPYCDDIINNSMVDACMRLLVTLCLLDQNLDIIERMPLEDDRVKWEASHDLKYIEKAERRGKKGWDIGRHVETAPGFRRPHFAVRWMGKGPSVPKIPKVRPIKGCLVKKKQITEVPTDWMGNEEETYT